MEEDINHLTNLKIQKKKKLLKVKSVFNYALNELKIKVFDRHFQVGFKLKN